MAPWQSAAERRRYGGAFAGWGTVAESHREAFAGRGAEVERLQRSGAVAEMLAAAWRIAIGKKLLPGRTIGKKMLAGDAVAERLSGCAEEVLLAGAPWQSCRLAGAPLLYHREEIGKNLKSTRKPHTELLVEEGEEDSILFCNFGGKM